MSSMYVRIVQKNKIIFIVLMLLFSLLSLYMPHGLFEVHEHHDHESLFSHVLGSSKPTAGIRRLLKKLRAVIYKFFSISQKLTIPDVVSRIRLALFNVRSSNALILHLFSVLCFSLYGGKYRQVSKHSVLLPLMAF